MTINTDRETIARLTTRDLLREEAHIREEIEFHLWGLRGQWAPHELSEFPNFDTNRTIETIDLYLYALAEIRERLTSEVNKKNVES